MLKSQGITPRIISFRKPVLWVSIAVAVVLVGITFGVLHMQAGAHSTPQSPASHIPVTGGSSMLTITNSGSTNMPASTLTLHADGSGTLTYQGKSQFQHNLTNKAFPADTFNMAELLPVLTQLQDVSAIPNHGCLKSASFGSTTTVTYNGKTSGDLSCLSNQDKQEFVQIKELVMKMYYAAIKH